MLQRITLAGLVAMMAVSTDLYLPAIPQLIESLGASVSQGQMTLSFFLFGFAAGQLFYGGISDRYGRKPVLYLGLAIYAAATLGCAAAVDINSLLVARFIQGIGGATYAAMFCYISTTSFITIELLGVRPEYFGYTFTSVVFGYVTGAMTGSRLVNRCGAIRVLKLGQWVGLMAAAFFLLLALFDMYLLFPVLLASFLVFLAGGLSLSIGQMGAISELPKHAGKASSVFGFLQITFAALLGYLVGLFYNHTLVPTAIGIAVAYGFSALGFLIIQNTRDPDGVRTNQAGILQ